MPRLLILVPCQRVLVSEGEERDTSLISILEGVKISVLQNAPAPPAGTIVPMNWVVYACWKQEESDLDKKYEQRILFRNAKGQLMMETRPQTFSFDTRMVNIYTRFLNFPVAHTGICPISVEVRELGGDQWVEEASYPMLIEHELKASSPKTEAEGELAQSKTVIWHNV